MAVNTAGTATVELIIQRPGETAKKTLQGCFVKKEANVKPFIKKYIDPSANRQKYKRSDYFFYSHVSDFRDEVVNKAEITYKIPSWAAVGVTTQKPKTCTVNDPLITTFDGHFFLCCDSEGLYKSNFLAKCSKEVRINQALGNRNEFFGLGIDASYLVFIPFKTEQLQNLIYKVNDRDVFNKLLETGPLLLDDKTIIVGCYTKIPEENQRIKINIFGSQGEPEGIPPGATEDPAPAPLPPDPQEDNSLLDPGTVTVKFNHLMTEAERCLEDYINKGNGTLENLKDHFRGLLPDDKLRSASDVKELLEALKEHSVITVNDVHLLGVLAEVIQLRELKKKIEKFEADCLKKVEKPFAVIHLKTLVPLAVFGAINLVHILQTNPEILHTLWKLGAQVLQVYIGSVVFVLKVQSISSLKQLWKSYKDGSLKEKLKHAFNQMEEVKALSKGEEIDLEVTIDEREYREVQWELIQLEKKGESFITTVRRQRRHSVSCERDIPEELIVDILGDAAMKTTKSGRRHSAPAVCCERDVPEDEKEDAQVTRPAMTTEKPESKMKRESVKTIERRQRRHSVPCKGDFTEEMIVDTVGDAAMKNTKSGRRHSAPSLCCERDVPEDEKEHVSQKQAQVSRPAMTKEKPESKMKRRMFYSNDAS